MPERESSQGVARAESSSNEVFTSEGNSEPPQLKAVEVVDLLSSPVRPSPDPATVLKDAGLTDHEEQPTKLARRVRNYGHYLFVLRGLSARWSGEDALHDVYCWILSNEEDCLSMRVHYQSDWQWLRWLTSKCVDRYPRDGKWLLPQQENTPDLAAPDNIEAQVAFEDLLDDLLDDLEKNSHDDFLALLNNIELRGDHPALAALLGLSVPGLKALLRRFDRFCKRFLERRTFDETDKETF